MNPNFNCWIALNYLELMKLLLEHEVSYCKLCCSWWIRNNTVSARVSIRLISQLINDISSVLQKFLECFNRTAVSILLVPATLVLFVNFDLNLNYSESANVNFGPIKTVPQNEFTITFEALKIMSQNFACVFSN